ncbi:MAG: DUF5011 domain-containing protein [Bacillota bacterium]|nr:DUF5011 domain-containing protein [Bacillota bacterium]
MLKNRNKVIYTGLAILVSMTSNIYTFPICATENTPKNEKYQIQLNGNENQQIQEIVVEKMNENQLLRSQSAEVVLVSEKEDSVYYLCESTLIKAETIDNKEGKQDVVIQTVELTGIEETTLDTDLENKSFSEEMVVGIEKEDTSAPVITLKNNKIRLSTNDTFIEEDYVQNVTDNVDEEINVVSKSNVDLSQAGSYEVVYTAKDKAGNESEETLLVEVVQGINYQAIADAAIAQIGVAQDCTMLVTNSLKAVGINFHGAPIQYTALGDFTNNPVPGDICIYEGHVAIYIGNGRAIHGGFDGMTKESSVACANAFIGYIHVRG